LLKGGGEPRNEPFNVRARRIAVVSTVVWIGVIVSGRLIAYLDLGYY
jgi:hypothetical protein